MSSPALGRPKSDTCKFGHTFTQGSTRQFCQECKNRATQRWREAHPERFRELKRKQSLRDNFNLTHEDYQAMWKEQKGLCAACGNPMPE